MTWFFIALLAPALWAASNLIDKHLLESVFKERSTASFYLFSGLAGVVIVATTFLGDSSVLYIPLKYVVILLGGSVLGSGMLYCYLRAIRLGEASVVTILFQLIPVFSLGLGYLAFHEVLGISQLAGSAVIIVGAMLLSFELSETKIVRLKGKIIGWMLLACLLGALSALAFKWVGIHNGFRAAVFWDYAGIVLIAATVFTVAPLPRREFLETLLRSRKAVLGLLFFNEAITVTGSLCMSFATLMVPLALAQVVNGFQPVFVLLFGIIVALVAPRLNYEKLAWHQVGQKTAAVAGILLGTYLLGR